MLAIFGWFSLLTIIPGLGQTSDAPLPKAWSRKVERDRRQRPQQAPGATNATIFRVKMEVFMGKP